MEESAVAGFDEDDEVEDFEDEEDEDEEAPKGGAAGTSVSDVQAEKTSDKLVASDVGEEAVADAGVRQRVAARVEALKARYTRRMSLFELTGIIAESFNLLCRGRLPLVADPADPRLDSELRVVLQEIREGACPIVVEKNGEHLAPQDFDRECLEFHLDYVADLWRMQGRI